MGIIRCTKPRNSVPWGWIVLAAAALLFANILPVLIFGPE